MALLPYSLPRKETMAMVGASKILLATNGGLILATNRPALVKHITPIHQPVTQTND